MAAEQTDWGDLLDAVDWVGPADEYWPSHAGTRTLLRGLAADDARSVTMGLSHLWDSFVEYPNVFPPTAPAVGYVLALLDHRPGGDSVIRSPRGQLRPLRAHLLAWLSAVAEAVGDVREREFVELAGYSPVEYPASPWHTIRQLRPRMYDTVAAFLDDPHPAVRQEAIAAAAVLVRVPELAVHHRRIAAAARAFLAACTDPIRRRWAEEAFGELTAGN
ncbi:MULTISPECIES: hypothetical protein [Catenuloplanes]|uniref:Uncharacterized protein n=1 Tax=Catenuloplanes niger TaxID=587534 RepID=A0AAE4A1N7_9ACTN|nr:hypothetical protein [Catenuloplanes niger]MDR7327615.1 hypothetical protein [Catenuloplanes niger]